MTITLQAVNEIIASLESAGELSIKETKVMALAKAFKQLASENVAMRKTLGEVVYSSEEVEHDGCLTFVVNPDYVHDAADLLDGETPATDRIVAWIKADGVESGIKTIMVMLNHQAPGVSDAINMLRIYCSKLREVAKHD
ncbi:hypothetical protein RRQ98_004254 [Klebsiella pneumoniae]|nr:hypothetical protein [Klebsiella pneumoniae]